MHLHSPAGLHACTVFGLYWTSLPYLFLINVSFGSGFVKENDVKFRLDDARFQVSCRTLFAAIYVRNTVNNYTFSVLFTDELSLLS